MVLANSETLALNRAGIGDAWSASMLSTTSLLAREAAELGELEPSADPVQLAFDFQARLVAANTSFILQGDAGAFERALVAIHARLRVA
jgi:hypothetical protein